MRVRVVTNLNSQTVHHVYRILPVGVDTAKAVLGTLHPETEHMLLTLWPLLVSSGL